ncbi:MAG: hypothetical protein IJ720_00515 [Clostridia bacterium]|nr:hypothetical protein [Clostridia bacterium]MBQ8469900.1 hypothetical protein [Clostridia bacterium]MBR1703827.1 hypothetical protein [Clostridia bacterium]
MISLFFAGTICWVVAGIFGIAFQYETYERMSWKGVTLKALSSFGIFVYALVLILLYGNPTEAAILFTVGLVLESLGDTLVAGLEASGDGNNSSLHKDLVSRTRGRIILLGVTGVLFICAYFLQMVAFLKSIASYAVVTNYVGLFLIFFFVPPLFTTLGGMLSKFRVPETDTSVFIIGVFYILLTSALFASGTIFAFSLFPNDPIHAGWILLGTILFFLSMLMVSLRYASPEKYESIPMRITSRLLTFLGRMVLAGCAFLL